MGVREQEKGEMKDINLCWIIDILVEKNGSFSMLASILSMKYEVKSLSESKRQ